MGKLSVRIKKNLVKIMLGCLLCTMTMACLTLPIGISRAPTATPTRRIPSPGTITLTPSAVPSITPTYAPTDPPLPIAQQTEVAATRAASPLQGSVLAAGGKSAMGGTAGKQISIPVDFKAASSAGAVTEMRVRTGACFRENELSAVPWEPFAAQKSYPFYLPINWVGFYVTVQYRDAAGNLSPVYCDDISVEGNPTAP